MSDHKKQGYLTDNFRLFHLRSASGVRTDYHYHEFCKLLLLVSGSGGYSIDGQRYLLRAGDIVLVDSRCVHRPELDAAVPYERIILYISPEFLRRQSGAGCDLRGLFSGPHGPVLRLAEGRRQQIFRAAGALEEALAGGEFGREILATAALLGLLVELGRELARQGAPDPEPVMPADPRIQQMLAYIDAHLTEDLDIDTLAQAFYLSRYHMMRQFRRATGTTIHLYITQQRLLLAKGYIDAGMKATEACYRSGWRSYSAFTRACARHFGATPTGRAAAASAAEEGME